MSKFYFTEEQNVRLDKVFEDDVVENKEIQGNSIEEEVTINEIEISKKEEEISMNEIVIDKKEEGKNTLEDENLEIKYFWVRTL